MRPFLLVSSPQNVEFGVIVQVVPVLGAIGKNKGYRFGAGVMQVSDLAGFGISK